MQNAKVIVVPDPSASKAASELAMVSSSSPFAFLSTSESRATGSEAVTATLTQVPAGTSAGSWFPARSVVSIASPSAFATCRRLVSRLSGLRASTTSMAGSPAESSMVSLTLAEL